MQAKYNKLFEPYVLNNGVKIKNRLVVAPLTIYDSGPDGELTAAARNFWRDRFKGFGTWIIPFTNVHPSGIGFESPNAFHEENLATLKEYAEISHKQGAKAVIQLAHAGIQADPAMTQGYDLMGPSAIGYMGVRQMTDAEVREMVHAFAYATELAIRAGLDGVEIHGANGWLIQQFVSATYNQRTDHWGGSMEKRFNFPMEIIDAVDAVRQKYHRPDFIVGYRFSPEEPGADGLTMTETLALIDRLVTKPLQYIHISLWNFYKKIRRGGNTSQTRMEAVHERINGRVPFIGVGDLFAEEQGLKAFNTGWADFLAVGGSVELNPNLVELIKTGREDEIQSEFDWNDMDSYRFTPAMLYGTLAGNAMFPKIKQS
ncbi:NADH-dependent flavin oxidoreductase [Lactiplantibacillus garii]|uniref:NADH-dependent flavin oxidoreductase n=1 Tax=Lactiplantibacillus garii TaxID=2306423 RepID=A0A3R8J9A9_9LACO|nr:NADH-dependent flavin oxidoreductase [Lactiplantibacillus garii]RRK11462.1 NADH-dependent flavin oxidoreductase [Lactiplantibacillus garii]